MTATQCCVPACNATAHPGLARCATHEEARQYSRAWARRRRASEKARRQATSDRCQHGIGGGIVCGGALRTEVDRLSMIGRTRLVCDWCERRKAGRCRDCPRPVVGTVGRALRCAACRRVERAAATRRYEANHPKRVTEKQVAYHARADVRAQKAEYKRAWRKANPDKIRRQKRRAALRQSRKVLAYQDRYRAKHRAHLAEQQRARYRAQHPVPTPICKECQQPIDWTPNGGRPYVRCDACCWPHERRRREAVRARRQAEIAAAPDFGLAAKPVKVRRPRNPAAIAPTGERLCLAPGCTTVVAGRAKKCAACKARDTAQAVAVLAPLRRPHQRARVA